ncbi:C2H2 transcription factor [Blastomyces gilchristii SLH14081]|uniref:C2H2 transcription factor n=1 Tax=Blastomyces gilchristii (strain SLH14081) TaxID=559298 RepID=A0A179UZ86_BLAGS|nr:C2H2 transcription factor [Blastomyces gilchristii SLH14081]OAT12529.1 C2H2 transcription factor [Blastomyces gilchristii SLH14081]
MPPVMLAARGTREPFKNAAGQIYCDHPDCHKNIPYFKRLNEWNKHMDKHDCSYKCTNPDCNKRLEFIFSDGLCCHQHDVHQMNRKRKKKGNLKLHLRLHCSESLHAEITQLQWEVKGINSRLHEMEMELKQLRQLTGKDTHFTLSSSVQLPSCVELEAGISGN